MKEELLLCSCENVEHQLIFRYEENTDKAWFPEVYVTVHLVSNKNFFKRLKHAVMYLFGHKSRYGAFDEFILRPRDWKKVEDVSKYLKKTYLTLN